MSVDCLEDIGVLFRCEDCIVEFLMFYRLGVGLRDLEFYYKNIGELNSDYEVLYPVGRDENGDDGNGNYGRSESGSLMFDSSDADFSSEGTPSDEDEDDEDHHVSHCCCETLMMMKLSQ